MGVRLNGFAHGYGVNSTPDEPGERDEDPDEAPETPRNEERPPRVEDPPPEPQPKGPFAVYA
jgi:hypothetical protein